MNIYKNKFLSRIGLMHMIATNLCVWLNVLILETSHEIHESHHSHGIVGGGHHEDHVKEVVFHSEGKGSVFETIEELPRLSEARHLRDTHSGKN